MMIVYNICCCFFLFYSITASAFSTKLAPQVESYRGGNLKILFNSQGTLAISIELELAVSIGPGGFILPALITFYLLFGSMRDIAWIKKVYN